MKKLLSFTLAVLMMLSVASSAFAAYGNGEVELTGEIFYKNADDGILYPIGSEDFKPGDTIYFRVVNTGNVNSTTLNKYKLYYDLSMGKNYVETSSGGAAVTKYKANIATATSYQYKEVGTNAWSAATFPTQAAAQTALSAYLGTPANLNSYAGVTYIAGNPLSPVKYTTVSGNVDYASATPRATLEPTVVGAATYPTAYQAGTTAYNATIDGAKNAYFASIVTLSATPTFGEVSALVADYNGAGAGNYNMGSPATTIVTNASDFTLDGSPANEATVFALLKSQLKTTQYYFNPGDTTFTGTAYASQALAAAAYPAIVSGMNDAQFLAALGTGYYEVKDDPRWKYNSGAFTTSTATVIAEIVANVNSVIKVNTASATSFDYFVALKTKTNSSTKILDVIGDFGVYRTAGSFKSGNKFSTGFSLVNAKVGDGAKQTGTITVDSDYYVVKFESDADEVDIEFGSSGELAMFTVNASNQGDLNLEYTTKFDSDIADDYPNANLDFLNFKNRPTFNRIGTFYLYANKGNYIYEIVDGKLKEVDATWDSSYGAYRFKTRTLGSYIIADKKLTIKETPSSSTAPSSSAPSSSTGTGTGGTGNGGLKPNPGTGR